MSETQDKHRLLIKVYGIVQGVGFRPFISRIAMKHNIYGTVCNKGSFVEIYAQAPKKRIEGFLHSLEQEAPPRSVILKVKTEECDVIPEVEDGDGSDAHNGRFNIIPSSKEEGLVFVSPDIATCPDCEREMFDKNNRRYLHPFINCTACGPRLTILDSMPYDRVRTSMNEFPMCEECEWEYTHASTRRYHAQPVCCNVCGPELYLIGRKEKNADAIRYVRKLIKAGGIAAIKGIGGFHLCCDAKNEAAVKRLRTLKNRPYKPFALMMKNIDVAKRICVVSSAQEELLCGPQKPIILLEKRPKCTEVSSLVAPGNPNIGVMLPYTPLHLLIFSYPDNEEISDALVMTSGNPSGAPICMDDEEAIAYLFPMCDVILSNPRKIRIRSDDSVMSFYKDRPYMIRRSRGYAPLPVIAKEEIPFEVLGIGGELKNTFCLARKDMYYLSPYVGDMADLRSVRALRAAIERMERLLEIEPKAIACDMHPDYNTNEVAKILAEEKGIAIVEVQHHFAHIVSCMAENECEGPVIGVSFDGTGYGIDSSIWGGEFLISDLTHFERVGSVTPFVHVGGDLASREGWRIAYSILLDIYNASEAEKIAEKLNLGCKNERRAIEFLRKVGINTITSTSAGRLFDAVSALLGIKNENTFEGEAAMLLQFAAERACQQHKKAEGSNGRVTGQTCEQDCEQACFQTCFQADGQAGGQTTGQACEQDCVRANEYEAGEDKMFVLPTNALLASLTKRRLEDIEAGVDSRDVLALDFHTALANMIVTGCLTARKDTGLMTVALSGGVFQNTLLLKLCEKGLEREGFTVLTHSLVPANDGGIALGQATIAMRTLGKRTSGQQTPGLQALSQQALGQQTPDQQN